LNIKGMSWFKGYVRCILRGKYKELFLNLAIKDDISIWDFKMLNSQEAVFSIAIKDFFKLKPILRRTYTRAHVIKRSGFPFILAGLSRRKGLGIGLFFFIMLIYLFSSMIWTINIEGNEKIKDAEIYAAMEQLGIHRGMFKFQLDDFEEIQYQMLNSLHNSAYIGVKLKGTSLYFTVVEKVRPEKELIEGPINLVAGKDAVISSILAEKGLPLFKVNDRVKKGDILISGIMGNEEHNQLVTAKGVVKGIVWYEAVATVPLKQEWREYTGNFLERYYLAIGNRMVKYKGYGKIPYSNYQLSSSLKRLSVYQHDLPVGLVVERVLEYEEKSRIISEADAYQIALEQTKKDLFSTIGSDGEILSEKVLHRSTEHDKVTIKILFEVLENIAVPQPIIQGE